MKGGVTRRLVRAPTPCRRVARYRDSPTPASGHRHRCARSTRISNSLVSRPHCPSSFLWIPLVTMTRSRRRARCLSARLLALGYCRSDAKHAGIGLCACDLLGAPPVCCIATRASLCDEYRVTLRRTLRAQKPSFCTSVLSLPLLDAQDAVHSVQRLYAGLAPQTDPCSTSSPLGSSSLPWVRPLTAQRRLTLVQTPTTSAPSGSSRPNSLIVVE